MRKNVEFQMEDVAEIPQWTEAYPEHKFAVYKCCFLSTKPNAHRLNIDDGVLREYANTILGNFLVAKVQFGDAMSHEKDEIIYGYFPREQEVEFVEDDDVTKAYAYAVVSKRYSKEFNGIFEFDNLRNSSVEMVVETEDDDENRVLSFDIFGLTCLGKRINGSCPDADIEMVRFTAEEADAYFAKNIDAASSLKQFVETRKQSMAEKKTYKVDKSKESMSNADWSEVDKADLRNKIMAASNRAKLVKDVYLLVEDGWDDAPSENLKYPVMELSGDTFVYNRKALASAMAYAKQNDEQAVVNKVEKIYKKLDLDDTDGKEEKMSMEIEFAAVNIGDLWGRLWHEIDETRHWEYGIEGIYEEDNKKFAILRDRAQKLYRLDFSLTEEGLTVADEVVEVEQEFIETDNMKKFAEPENVSDYRIAERDDDDDDKDDDDDDETKMSEDEMMAKIAQLEKDIEERDNIIMERDTELADLRAFKQSVNEKERAMTVESVMCDIKDYVDNLTYNDLRDEGLACEFAALDAWVNKAKATCFGAVKKTRRNNGNSDTTVWGFSAPIEPVKKHTSIWE